MKKQDLNELHNMFASLIFAAEYRHQPVEGQTMEVSKIIGEAYLDLMINRAKSLAESQGIKLVKPSE